MVEQVYEAPFDPRFYPIFFHLQLNNEACFPSEKIPDLIPNISKFKRSQEAGLWKCLLTGKLLLDTITNP